MEHYGKDVLKARISRALVLLLKCHLVSLFSQRSRHSDKTGAVSKEQVAKTRNALHMMNNKGSSVVGKE